MHRLPRQRLRRGAYALSARKRRHTTMMDLAFIALTGVFFTLTWGFVRLCEKV